MGRKTRKKRFQELLEELPAPELTEGDLKDLLVSYLMEVKDTPDDIYQTGSKIRLEALKVLTKIVTNEADRDSQRNIYEDFWQGIKPSTPVEVIEEKKQEAIEAELVEEEIDWEKV